jgi:flagellar biosynthesis protein FlhF
MNVKRYFGKTAREALRKVKEELGGDAVVLANRSVEGGVEIAAVPAGEIAEELRAPFADAPRIEPNEDFTVSLSASARAAVPTRSETAPQRPNARFRQPAAAETTPAPPQSRSGQDGIADDGRLLRELADIRRLIERQLAGFAWSGLAHDAPLKSLLLGDLLEAGFSAHLARRLLEGLPADATREVAGEWLKGVLNRHLLTAGDDGLVEAGGTYALVGPTGVGKTTTTAKLAARCVVRYGAQSVALVTTDGYRIGAHEQLRIYGRILGVPVYAVRDGADLRRTLADLAGRHLVLIDTIGMSQRDRLVSEQTAMLAGAGEVRRLLLMNATGRGDTLDDVVCAYGQGAGALAGAILTKVDEAVSLGPALDALIRHRLALHYVANGQRVPEDLHLPHRAYLLHRALKGLPQDSPHRLLGDEAGLLLAAAGTASDRALAHGQPV